MDHRRSQNRTRFGPSLVKSGKEAEIAALCPKWVCSGVLLAFIGMLSACSGPALTTRPYEGELPMVVDADWDDIVAAMSRSRLRTESIRVTHTTVGSGEAGSVARYEMISITDEDVWVELKTLEDWPSEEGPVPIEISIGSRVQENDEYNRVLVGEIAHHLRTLAGKDIAPVD